jgi:hypothetical protein
MHIDRNQLWWTSEILNQGSGLFSSTKIGKLKQILSLYIGFHCFFYLFQDTGSNIRPLIAWFPTGGTDLP